VAGQHPAQAEVTVKRLQRRILGAGTAMARAQDQMIPLSGDHPAGTSATPMVAPMAEVHYQPVQGYPWGTASYHELHPVYSPDGALIAAYDSGYGKGAYPIPAGRASPAHQ
jgi:hypothetical protein